MSIRSAVGLSFRSAWRPVGWRPIHDIGIARSVGRRRIFHDHASRVCNNVASTDVPEALP